MSFSHRVKEELSQKEEPALHCRRAYEASIGVFSRGGKTPDQSLLWRDCCRRAYIRGAFISSGSVTDPEKNYHFEVICGTMEAATQLADVISEFNIDAKVLKRKGSYVVYVKEASNIADLLTLMGAHGAVLEMESVRVVKDVRNHVNRQVNCETANLSKTVSAALKEIEAIDFLEEKGILAGLSPGLRQMASLRRNFPDSPLKELGEMCDPPVGKSGANHRLKKLMKIAEDEGM